MLVNGHHWKDQHLRKLSCLFHFFWHVLKVVPRVTITLKIATAKAKDSVIGSSLE